MKEFPLTYNFSSGLRSNEKNPVNSKGLTECYNIILRQKLEGYQSITDPFGGAVDLDWPFPQLFLLNTGDFLLCERDGIYSVDDWSITKIASPTGGGLWRLLDAYDYFIILNGIDIYSGTCPCGDLVDVSSSIPNGVAACFHKGQIYVGNVTEGAFFVKVSDIGSATFTHNKMNVAASRPIPIRGNIYEMKPLGDHVVIYGSNGIVALTPVIGPAPAAASFRLTILTSFGIPCQGAVGGDEGIHLFVDSSGILYMIDPSLSIKELGYQEYFSGMLGNNIIVNYDNQLKDFYIGDGTSQYILTSGGLSEIGQKISTCISYGGGPIGIYSNLADQSAYLETDWIDMFNVANKYINSQEIGMMKKSTTKGYISTTVLRTSYGAGVTLPSFPINPKGNAAQKSNGNRFKFKLSFTSPEDLELSYMKIRWGLQEKNFIRGQYANEINI